MVNKVTHTVAIKGFLTKRRNLRIDCLLLKHSYIAMTILVTNRRGMWSTLCSCSVIKYMKSDLEKEKNIEKNLIKRRLLDNYEVW